MFLPALIVHGGAGAFHADLAAAQTAGCTAALRTGWEHLIGGGSALDAVCAAVVSMETDPTFNAGVGSCLTSAGTVEMDASVMEGGSLQAGAVAVVQTVRHPVLLARAVMERTRHIMLAGPAADAAAREWHLPTCAPEALVTAHQIERWKRSADRSPGTVGAVAVDRHGHVAAATSTGGRSHKRPGRVGDSAIIGAGTYADDALGAASATGDGEAILRLGLAKRVVDALADGRDAQSAAGQGIEALGQRVASTGGIIVVDALGRIGFAFNTPHMTVGHMRADQPAPVLVA